MFSKNNSDPWNLIIKIITDIVHFILLCFIVLHRYVVFCFLNKLRVCDNPVLSMSTGAIFLTTFIPFVYLSHILVILGDI